MIHELDPIAPLSLGSGNVVTPPSVDTSICVDVCVSRGCSLEYLSFSEVSSIFHAFFGVAVSEALKFTVSAAVRSHGGVSVRDVCVCVSYLFKVCPEHFLGASKTSTAQHILKIEATAVL